MTDVHYHIRAQAVQAQTFEVRLTLAQPAAVERLSLPVWIAGSYLVREFSRHIHSLRAHCAGVAAEVVQRNKNTWDIHCPPVAEEGATLEIGYQVVACDASVRAAWLSAERGFFNGTSLLLRSHSRDAARHRLTVERPTGPQSHWKLATAAEPADVDANGWGTYTFANYEEAADTPFEMGAFWSADFDVLGVPHRFVVAGAPEGFDGQRLVRDTQRICQTHMEFWHPGFAKSFEKSSPKADEAAPSLLRPTSPKVDLGRGQGLETAQPRSQGEIPEKTPGQAPASTLDLARPPHRRYVFLLHVSAGGYGGLEHRASTALICDHGDLPVRGAPCTGPATGGYRTLLGLISHEYFHTWNVKRLRPLELERIDFERENFTQMLWFFEGLTSYYDDLLLRRAGLIDQAGYVDLLGKTLAQVLATPGRHIHSAAQASFEAWTKYYRPDEQSPNTTVSYYTKGALIGLCLDLQLRRASDHAITLDHVMRTLWLRSAAGPIGERDVLEALMTLTPVSAAASSAPDWPALLHSWVHGTQDLPVAQLLADCGVAVELEAPTLAQRLGLRVRESANQPIEIKHVLRGGAGEAAGFVAGDRWWAIELAHTSDDTLVHTHGAWTLHTLDDLRTFAAGQDTLTALVERGRRVLRLPLHIPSEQAVAGTPKLRIRDEERASAWLHGAQMPC